MEHGGNDNNYNAHSRPSQGSDILTSTLLKDFEDKSTLLKNIGYLCGIRVDNNSAPQSLNRQPAKYVGDEPPVIEEMNDFLTELIPTKTERETNYVHCGWSIAAVSAISPWTSSRIAANNQPNPGGAWLTRRALVRRLRMRVSLDDLAPSPEFKSEIETALSKPTIFKQFESVYRALHKWGDVVPLEIEMGVSLALTDLETNMPQQLDMTSWDEIRRMVTNRTARLTTQEGTDCSYWNNGVWPNTTISPPHWRQIRITEVVATTNLLPTELQDQISRLYIKRLSYAPVIARGDNSSTNDDTPYASGNVIRVIICASAHIRTITLQYADKVSWRKHKGTETEGSWHDFTLTDGEFITEILIWKGEWVYGLQFITNFGRCSLHFGGSWGTPTMARSKGGVFVGFTSLTKQDGSVVRVRDIQAIWRHDVVDAVPKENDLFSEYFGSKDKGNSFNDRTTIRNSDMAISKIEIRCGGRIDSLQFTYIDRVGGERDQYQAERHGGQGGNKKEFALEPGEHIAGVSGKYDDDGITQVRFATNTSRMSEVFGEGRTTKVSSSFSLSSPKDTGGKQMRLQYICGKSDSLLNGIMFVWTPM